MPLSDPTGEFAAVTPHDTNAIRTPRALFVGVAGNVAVSGANNSSGSVIFKGVPAGSILPIRPRLVLSTGTTATDIIALY